MYNVTYQFRETIKLFKQYFFLIYTMNLTQYNKNLIEELNIKSYPSFKIYKNRKLIENIIGTYSNICSIINLHIM